MFYNFVLESTHMKTPPFPNLYGLVLDRKGLSQRSLPRDSRGASDIFCMCDFPGLVCAISQRALLAPSGACLWHCKFSGATAARLPCPVVLRCHQPSRVCGLISDPRQVRQIPFLCVVPWEASGAPESLSTLLPLSQRRETLSYVCAFSQSCQVAWAIGCHSSLSLVSAAFIHSYYASFYSAASEARQKPSLWAALHGVGVLDALCSLSLLKEKSEAGCSCLALSCGGLGEAGPGKVNLFFLSVSVQLFSALCSLRVLQLLS